MKRLALASFPAPAPAPEPLETAATLRQLLGVGRKELLTTEQIARDYQFPSREAARKWLMRHEVPARCRGRVLLVDRRDLEAKMPPPKTKRSVR